MIGKLSGRIRMGAAEFIRGIRASGSHASTQQFNFHGNPIVGPSDMISAYASNDLAEFVSILQEELQIATDSTGLRDFAVIDIGANIGVYSIGYSLAGAKRIVAFEPFPETFAFLERNVKNSTATNVEIYPFGLFSQTVTMPIGTPAAFKNHGPIRRLLKRADQKQLGCMSIYTNAKSAPSVHFERGDECRQLTHLTSVGLVKIDVEGAEPEVIKGLAAFIQRNRPVLKVELSVTALAAAKSSVTECRHLFSSLGYTHFLPCNRYLKRRNWMPIEKIDDLDGAKDILLVQN